MVVLLAAAFPGGVWVFLGNGVGWFFFVAAAVFLGDFPSAGVWALGDSPSSGTEGVLVGEPPSVGGWVLGDSPSAGTGGVWVLGLGEPPSAEKEGVWSIPEESSVARAEEVLTSLCGSPGVRTEGAWSSLGKSPPVGVLPPLGDPPGVGTEEVWFSFGESPPAGVEGVGTLREVGMEKVWPFTGESPPAGQTRLADGGLELIFS